MLFEQMKVGYFSVGCVAQYRKVHCHSRRSGVQGSQNLAIATLSPDSAGIGQFGRLFSQVGDLFLTIIHVVNR